MSKHFFLAAKMQLPVTMHTVQTPPKIHMCMCVKCNHDFHGINHTPVLLGNLCLCEYSLTREYIDTPFQQNGSLWHGKTGGITYKGQLLWYSLLRKERVLWDNLVYSWQN